MGINRDALYSIGKGFYRDPEESPSFSKLTLRFRTAREDVESVSLILPEDGRELSMRWHSNDF